MSKPNVTEADLKRARKIHNALWPFQGMGGASPNRIISAIARGISEGREQGLELAKKAAE